MSHEAAVNYVRRGARIGGIAGGVGGGLLGAAAGGLPKNYADPTDGKIKKRTTAQRIGGAAIVGGLGAHVGHGLGRAAGAVRNYKKVVSGKFVPPRPKPPEWLRHAKTKAEGRRAYHAEARKVHPDLHGGDDSKFKNLGKEWSEHEPHFKTAMLIALADELEKIAAHKQAAVGAILGGGLGYSLSPNSLKGKVIGTALGAGIGHMTGAAAKGAKKMLIDDPEEYERYQLYNHRPVAQAGQGSNFY